MVEIECLVCGKVIVVPQFIDTENYDGQVSCHHCASLFHVRLVASKVRKYKLLQKDSKTLAKDRVSGTSWEAESEAGELSVGEMEAEKIARYNPLRDFLATYRAATLELAFEQIETMIGHDLETSAYTIKSWWANDKTHCQALAWLEAGWQVADVDLVRRKVIFRRESENL